MPLTLFELPVLESSPRQDNGIPGQCHCPPDDGNPQIVAGSFFCDSIGKAAEDGGHYSSSRRL
jgi:hypothetical protein